MIVRKVWRDMKKGNSISARFRFLQVRGKRSIIALFFSVSYSLEILSDATLSPTVFQYFSVFFRIFLVAHRSCFLLAISFLFGHRLVPPLVLPLLYKDCDKKKEKKKKTVKGKKIEIKSFLERRIQSIGFSPVNSAGNRTSSI